MAVCTYRTYIGYVEIESGRIVQEIFDLDAPRLKLVNGGKTGVTPTEPGYL